MASSAPSFDRLDVCSDALVKFAHAQDELIGLLKELCEKLKRGAASELVLRSPDMYEALSQRYQALDDTEDAPLDDLKQLCVDIQAFRTLVEMELDVVRGEEEEEA